MTHMKGGTPPITSAVHRGADCQRSRTTGRERNYADCPFRSSEARPGAYFHRLSVHSASDLEDIVDRVSVASADADRRAIVEVPIPLIRDRGQQRIVEKIVDVTVHRIEFPVLHKSGARFEVVLKATTLRGPDDFQQYVVVRGFTPHGLYVSSCDVTVWRLQKENQQPITPTTNLTFRCECMLNEQVQQCTVEQVVNVPVHRF